MSITKDLNYRSLASSHLTAYYPLTELHFIPLSRTSKAMTQIPTRLVCEPIESLIFYYFKVYNCFFKPNGALLKGKLYGFLCGVVLDDKGAIQQESKLITIVQVQSESLKNIMGETIKTIINNLLVSLILLSSQTNTLRAKTLQS